MPHRAARSLQGAAAHRTNRATPVASGFGQLRSVSTSIIPNLVSENEITQFREIGPPFWSGLETLFSSARGNARDSNLLKGGFLAKTNLAV
jgi:hypothetical protein